MNLWTDEDEDLLIRALWARANGRRLRADEPTPARGTMFGFQARAVLQALADAGRLVPPGSEVREEFGVHFANSSGQGHAIVEIYEDREEADQMTAHMASLSARRAWTMRRIAAYGPWSPSVPDTEEGS